MPRFRKKPGEIEAMQFDGSPVQDPPAPMQAFCGVCGTLLVRLFNGPGSGDLFEQHECVVATYEPVTGEEGFVCNA